MTTTENRYDFNLNLGETWTKNITWTTGSPAVAVNLTGYTARMYIRMESYNRPVEIMLTDANSRIVFDAVRTTGKFTLKLTAAETEALNGGRAGVAVYDLELVMDTYVKRLLQGEITLVREVTR